MGWLGDDGNGRLTPPRHSRPSHRHSRVDGNLVPLNGIIIIGSPIWPGMTEIEVGMTKEQAWIPDQVGDDGIARLPPLSRRYSHPLPVIPAKAGI